MPSRSVAVHKRATTRQHLYKSSASHTAGDNRHASGCQHHGKRQPIRLTERTRGAPAYCSWYLATDTTPVTCFISHESYLWALLRYRDYIVYINLLSSVDFFELLTLLAYLEKNGNFQVTTVEQMEKFETEWSVESLDLLEVRKRRRKFFVSKKLLALNAIVCSDGRVDVRRFVLTWRSRRVTSSR